MSESNLHPTAEALQGFVEGFLDASDRAILESHLLGCAACRGAVGEWRSLFSVLASLPHHEPSAGFAKRVMAHVQLPDPWYVRLGARLGAQLQALVPKTTRGWAAATACLGLPIASFAALAAWLLSRPYITPQELVAFTYGKAQAAFSTVAQGTISTVLQSEAALYAARGLEAVDNAGMGAAGALFFALALATMLSVWVLYQNLFRTTTTRDSRHYVSYSF